MHFSEDDWERLECKVQNAEEERGPDDTISSCAITA